MGFGGKGKQNGNRQAQEEISRTLGRILRYESERYQLSTDSGWVSFDELLEKCKSQIRYTKEEVLSVARESEGSKGKRFEVDQYGKRVRAAYSHAGEREKGKAKGAEGPKGAAKGAWKPNAQDAKGAATRETSDAATRNGHEDPLQRNDPWERPARCIAPSGRPSGRPLDEKAEVVDISTPREAVQEKTWRKYTCPDSGRLWLHDADSQEFFFEDAPRGWRCYDSEYGKWWQHEQKPRWFFDPMEDA